MSSGDKGCDSAAFDNISNVEPSAPLELTAGGGAHDQAQKLNTSLQVSRKSHHDRI